MPSIPNLTLAYEVLQLKTKLEGAFLNKVQRVNERMYRFRFHTKEGSKDLLFNGEALYFTSYKLEAEQKPSGFSAYLKKQLYNKRVDAFYQQGFDRVLVFEFTAHNLIFELFGDSNIVLTDKSWKTLSALTYGEWKDRAIKRNLPYQFPASKGLNPAYLNAGQLRDQVKGPDLIRALITHLNVAPPLAEEALHRLNIPKSMKPEDLSEAQRAQLAETLAGFYAKPTLDKLQPVYYAKQQLLLPFPLPSLEGAPMRSFASLDEAFDALVWGSGATEPAAAAAAQVSSAKKAETTRQGKEAFLAAQQAQARQKFERVVVESQQKAEAIYSHYPEIEALLCAVRAALSRKVPEADALKKLQAAHQEGKTKLRVLTLDFKTRTVEIETP